MGFGHSAPLQIVPILLTVIKCAIGHSSLFIHIHGGICYDRRAFLLTAGPQPGRRNGRYRSGNSCTYGEAAGKPRTWGRSRYREFPASSGSCAAYRAGPWILFPWGPPWVTPPSAVPVRAHLLLTQLPYPTAAQGPPVLDRHQVRTRRGRGSGRLRTWRTALCSRLSKGFWCPSRG